MKHGNALGEAQRQSAPCRLSAAVKRPRDSLENSEPIREAVWAFGERAMQLEAEVFAANGPSATARVKVWKLLLDLRPFIFAALPSMGYEIPEPMRKSCHADMRRVRKYVWMTLRVYMSVARLGGAVPDALLHCVLSLLSLLPAVGVLSLPCAADERFFFDGIQFTLTALRLRYPFLFSKLLSGLLREDTMGAFIFSSTQRGPSTSVRCTIEIADPPEVSGVAADAKQLFTSTIIAETPYERLCVARGLCNVMGVIFSFCVPVQPTLRERSVVLRLACSWLAVDVREGSVARWERGSANTPAERKSSGSKSSEDETNPLVVIHTTATSLLQTMLEKGLLVKVLHGPMLLYTLTQNLYEASQMKFSGRETLWELKFLRWLVEKDDSYNALPPQAVSNSLSKSRPLETSEASFSSREWLTEFFLQTRISVDAIFALIGGTNNQEGLEVYEMAALLLSLLREAVLRKNGVDRLVELAFCDVGAELVDAVLGVRVMLPMLWFSDMSTRVCVLYQLFDLFPEDIVASLLRKHLSHRCVYEAASGHVLAAANASVLLNEGDAAQAALLHDAWTRLLSTGADEALDAVVILARVGEGAEVERAVEELLRVLAARRAVVRCPEPPLRLSLLYAELLRKLPLQKSALAVIVDAIRAQMTEQEVGLWCLLGIVRGFRERVARRCYHSTGTASAQRVRREEADTGMNTVVESLEEIRVVLDALNLFLPVLTAEDSNDESIGVELQILFWEQMVALMTEVCALHEWMRSHVSRSDCKEKKKRVDANASVGKEGHGLDLSDDVIVVTPNDQLQQHDANVVGGDENDMESGSSDSVDKLLRGIAAGVEGLGWAAHTLFLARQVVVGGDTLRDMFFAFICLSVAVFPVRWSAMEGLVLLHGMGHRTASIRGGYAALVVFLQFTRWGAAEAVQFFRESVSRLQEAGEAQLLLLQLETLRAAFSDEWQATLRQGVRPGEHSAGVTCLPLSVASSPRHGRDDTACCEMLHVCAGIWEHKNATPASMSAALDAARAIMTHLKWWVNDLCWRDPGVIHTSFFKAMCNAEQKDVQHVVMNHLDDILPPCLLSEDGAENLQGIRALLGGDFSLERNISGAIAHILLEDARAPPSVKLEKLNSLFGVVGKQLRELPKVIEHSPKSLIVSLMYLEGGRRLRKEGMGQHSDNNTDCSYQNSKGGALSEFDIAVELALSIGECGPLASDIAQALEMPTEGAMEQRALTKYVFGVLDKVALSLGVSDGVSTSCLVSTCTAQRWLYGLRALIHYLGGHATLIAPKLPAILEECSMQPQLIRSVCAVWRDLLLNCTVDYLKEHSPAIVVDLLSMEQQAEGDDSDALLLLEAAVRVVYEGSSEEVFWKSYFKVMSHTSMLIRRLRDDSGKSLSCKVTPDVAAYSPLKDSSAAVVVAGFLSVMQSSSIKCKEMFVCALYEYLSTTDSTGRMEMTHVAGASAQLIPTLLKCACELREEYAQYVLACVGMIGAIAYSHTTIPGDDEQSLQRGNAAPSSKARFATTLQPEKFLPEDVLNWRTLAHKLLSVHCPRALANTADPTMHDRAAFGVQQLLRVCADAERKLNGHLPLLEREVLYVEELQRYAWWSHLDPTCRQMLEGYTTTEYTARILQKAEPHSPVYTTGMTFHVWLKAWFCDLALRCDGVFGHMMDALRNMAKADHALMSFLIPHIIVRLVRDGNNIHKDAVIDELNVLLRTASTATLSGKEKGLSLHSQNLIMEVATSTAEAHSVEEHVQQVFHFLEDIEHLCLVLLRAVRGGNPKFSEDINKSDVVAVIEACQHFLSRIEWTTRVEAAVAIGSNMRALRYIEGQRYLPTVSVVIQENLPLQHIFAALGDRDSSRSLHRTQELQPEDAAFSYENNGEWNLALQACELVLQQRPNSVTHQLTALHCMQQLGQLHLMSRYSQALLVQSTRSPSDGEGSDEWCWQAQPAALQNYANEAAWRLAEWETIETRQDLPVSLALPMVSFTNFLETKGTLEEVRLACAAQRQKIAPVIRAACRESYIQVYPHVVVLHALTDVETAAEFVAASRTSSLGQDDEVTSFHLSSSVDARRLQEFESLLSQRAALTDTTLETQELLISVHRSIYRSFGMTEEVTKTWMHHAKLLRNEGFLEAALTAAKQARLGDGFIDTSYYTTLAKLLHEMHMPNQAIELAEDLANNGDIPSVTRAKLRVLVTRWRQDISYQTSQEAITAYESALQMHATEKAHHYLALFYDTLYHSALESKTMPEKASQEEENKKVVNTVKSYVLRAIDHFGKALLLGGKTVTVSLPRMLTLWLNCTVLLSAIAADSSRSSAHAASVMQELNSMMERYLLDSSVKLPATLLVTALPQLLSRIGQDNASVVGIITRTVVDLMMTFPQQCLWQVLPIAFSKQTGRSETARQGIVAQFLKLVPAMKKMVENMSALFKSLIDLCNCPATSLTSGRTSSEGSLAGQSFIQKIQRMLPSAGIILPTMANLSPNVMCVANTNAVFSGSATFQSFEDRVVIMHSLQKPKRITVISSEGARVPFLCKSRDEPRKDMRMMEIASLMNTFFLMDPEARRKRFSLRRYAIAALTDDCAVIEWVNNLSPFHKVVDECYLLNGTGVRISQVKAWKAQVDSGNLSKMDMFEKHILPRTRPVLHNWFHNNFFSHQEWHQARTIYTQATALWSIAGHIVGLGDRHGENLMIDLRHGELMHVDFACMFDKGEMLEVPERVRFRLTQNVVDGMGVLGVDGPFRITCQVALRCQMKNKTAVMSVVETLLHDPLVEWKRQSSTSRDRFDPKRLIERVSRRLDGFLDLYSPNHEKDTLALGCEGQASRLISHSSALENLSEMYIWWMAWL
ncbi:phosphatidylinositol 3-related kinase [Trypanosoma grayi]|uniref:phosphatidylinositol 3-related kinase n=1 Tax=Trypanosoma grayi TaxID=71804 RepID=UPI0004F4B173|nr:phosphatidylinositol 3-related kinase [Trypanosoma grayi]KEG15372.1 phosphatidylinositol 3-related kinase [Trypanosoma grayi]